LTSSPRRPSPAARAVRRSRRPAPRSTTFLERNRTRLLWAGGILVFVALAFAGLILPGLTPAYSCVNTFDPTPAPSFVAPSPAPVSSGATPAPAVTAPAPGYVEPDMGHVHENNIGAKITYTWCPPASGRHFPAPGGPIKPGIYDPGEKTVPGGWIHNLEHGAIVLLYKCPGPGCDDAGQAALEALYARWPNSPICNKAPGADVTPVITRFDDMPYNYAALVWDMVLPMDSIDENELFSFYAAYGEQFNPEKQCAAPTSSPPAPTAAPAAASPAATTVPSTEPSPAGS
jgi:Protein of unknown function (DUF3105)